MKLHNFKIVLEDDYKNFVILRLGTTIFCFFVLVPWTSKLVGTLKRMDRENENSNLDYMSERISFFVNNFFNNLTNYSTSLPLRITIIFLSSVPEE